MFLHCRVELRPEATRGSEAVASKRMLLAVWRPVIALGRPRAPAGATVQDMRRPVNPVASVVLAAQATSHTRGDPFDWKLQGRLSAPPPDR